MQNFINNICFDKKWIDTKKNELSGDSVLIEKAINAFSLLGYLVQTKMEFVFKGGTSLLLHVPQIKRLSIDIDIVLKKEDLAFFIKQLDQIPGKIPFTRYEEDVRGDRGLPNRKHFKFFYKSSISNQEEYILLDIVLENPQNILFIEKKLIITDFIIPEKELAVNLPSIEGLMGDKLIAFAPKTLGVPYINNNGDNINMQVVKQLFDVGELFNIASDTDNVIKAYNNTFKIENNYHENKYNIDEVLNDTLDISHRICLMKFTGYQAREDTDNIEDGVKRIQNHLLNQKFTIHHEAKITASKIFYIINSIKNNNISSLDEVRYINEKLELIKDISLSEPYNWANKLKAVLPEAFYYIWQGSQV